MISLDLSISGGELGRKLAYDEEELAYALVAIVEERHDAQLLGEELQEHLPYGEAAGVVTWLRALADGIERDKS